SDASFSGGTRAAEVHCAFEKAVDRLACTGWLSHRTERLVGQLRRAAPCRIAGRHRDHRRDGQFSGEPPDEQIAANALVAARGGSSASGSRRRLYWHARLRLRTEIPARQRSAPASSSCGLTPPNLQAVPAKKLDHLNCMAISRV